VDLLLVWDNICEYNRKVFELSSSRFLQDDQVLLISGQEVVLKAEYPASGTRLRFILAYDSWVMMFFCCEKVVLYVSRLLSRVKSGGSSSVL